MKNIHPAIYAISAGLLLAISWPPLPFVALIFLALCPLFFLVEKGLKRAAFLGWIFLAMLTWNTICTWWIWNSTGPGSVAAIIANSLLMCLPWLAFYNVNKRLGRLLGYWAFVACWMSFEYIHLNWELSWPWLTLGNVFASRPDWVQWYEFTGTSGGTLWVLLLNGLIFACVLPIINNRKTPVQKLWWLLPAIGLPLVFSYLLKPTGRFTADPVKEHSVKNIVIVQPNIDPYQKFEAGTQQSQLAKLLRLSEAGTDSNTALIAWPETAINLPNGIEEDSLKKNYLLNPLWDFLKKHPSLKLFTGIEGYKLFTSENKTVYAKQIQGTDLWYEAYNTAALIDSSGIVSRYHKSKLVPGVETLPSFLGFMGKWFEQFGGTTGGYARQQERTILADPADGYAIAPAICYESIYGEFMTGFMRNGGNIIGIITNDGWWGNTAGHKQHLLYARLRAIENRRWVIRSANTGISAFIDPYGKIIQPQPWDKEAVIRQVVPPGKQLTFYSKYGDMLSKIMLAASIVLLVYSSSILVRNLKNTATG